GGRSPTRFGPRPLRYLSRERGVHRDGIAGRGSRCPCWMVWRAWAARSRRTRRARRPRGRRTRTSRTRRRGDPPLPRRLEGERDRGRARVLPPHRAAVPPECSVMVDLEVLLDGCDAHVAAELSSMPEVKDVTAFDPSNET